MEDYFQVGILINTHGIKGEAKILPTTDDPKRFELLDKVFVVKDSFKKELVISNVRYDKKFVLLKFEGYNSINDIEHLKQASLQIRRSEALSLEEDEYYIRDLIGLKVYTDENKDLGVIKDVIITGSNDVYVVENDDNKQILLPAIKECVLNVNIDKGYINVHLMKGLID
ncbi:MAG: ribosome maturation factor RimM [Eubacteriales bacterium]